MADGNPSPEFGTAVSPEEQDSLIDWRLINEEIELNLHDFHRCLSERTISIEAAEESLVGIVISHLSRWDLLGKRHQLTPAAHTAS